MAMRGPSWFFLPSAVLGSALVTGVSCGDGHPAPVDAAGDDAGIQDASVLDAALPDAAVPDAGSIGGPPPSAPVYFLVAELPGRGVHGDSYVLPVTRPEHIEHARDLIRLGPDVAGSSIAVADIRLGADGINRDLRAGERPAWSWHVTELVAFGDCTIEILDGWPGLVEMDPEGWMKNTPPSDENPDVHGRIGFWSYTVVVELIDYPEDLELQQRHLVLPTHGPSPPPGRDIAPSPATRIRPCAMDITAPGDTP